MSNIHHSTVYRRYTTEHKQSVETVPETNCLAECAHLTITVSQIEQYIGRKSSFSYSPLAFDACNEVGFVQYITTHSYHGVIEVRIAIQVYGDCSPHSNSLRGYFTEGLGGCW